MERRHPGIFKGLSQGQAPPYLWITCADSRVPGSQAMGLGLGAMFIHRNIANVVRHDDPNALAVIQYAVDVLRVAHIIVCGHYGCGGALAALRRDSSGPLDDWLRPVRDVAAAHREELAALGTEAERHRRLCELNVIEQVTSVGRTEIVRGAWARGQTVEVHGWIYGLEDGLLRDLGVCVTGEPEGRSDRVDCSHAARSDAAGK